MTFEEFFKKKKIDLDAFQQGNPALLSEFKKHFELMGEKSFDHTKKFWFNKLRLQYHLAPEVKTEKVKIENPLAQQTVTNTLAESTQSEPGPAATSTSQESPIAEQHTEDKAASPAPKPAFTPRFKPGVTKPAEQAKPKTEEKAPTEQAPSAEKPKGFTPRFKAGVTKASDTTETTTAANDAKADEPLTEKPKGFTPRFKAGVTKPVLPMEEKSVEPDQNNPAEEVPATPKGFTPRFKAGVTKTTSAPAEEEKQKPLEDEKPVEEKPIAENKPKMGFTPRFKSPAPPKQAKPDDDEQAK